MNGGNYEFKSDTRCSGSVSRKFKNTFALKSHSHAWSGITAKPSTFTPSTHNHTKSQITDFPTSLRNPQALTLQINGTTKVTYTGATAGSLNITPRRNRCSKTSHGTHVAFSTATPLMDGTASVGSNTSVARSDHRHPTDTSRAPASHTHAWSQVTGKPSTFAPSSHTHDDRYLTEAETTSKLNSKADNLTITATTLYAFVNAIIATDTFSCSGRFDTNGGTWAPAGDGWYKFWATFLNHDAATYEPSIQVILGRGEAFYVGYIAGKRRLLYL